LEHFNSLLREIAADSARPVSAYPILGEAEKRQILVEWNQTQADYAHENCIHELIEAQAKRTPDAIAVQFENQCLTYKELNERADAVAHVLMAQGVKRGILVGLYVNRSMDMLVGLLGVLKAGGAYLPLDPSFPAERLAFMLADSNAAIILTLSSLLPNLPDNNAQVICLDDLAKGRGGSNPKATVAPDDLAYVIYASGSTGRRK